MPSEVLESVESKNTEVAIGFVDVDPRDDNEIHVLDLVLKLVGVKLVVD